MICRRLRIEGRVQGVSYRMWAVETAHGLGLSGWVRNRHDGSVEVLAMGEEEAVADLVALCGQGPPAARVDHIDVTEAEADPVDGFRSRPTA